MSSLLVLLVTLAVEGMLYWRVHKREQQELNEFILHNGHAPRVWKRAPTLDQRD